MLPWLLSLIGAVVPAFIKGWFSKDAGKETGRLEVKVAEQAEVIKNAQDAKAIGDSVDGMSDADAERLRVSLNEP